MRYLSLAAIPVLAAMTMGASCTNPEYLAAQLEGRPVDISAFTKADLVAAAARATAGNDAVGAGCWTAIANHVPANVTVAVAFAGAFDTYEAARLARIHGAPKIPEDVHVACAPVVIDAERTAIRLGLIGGGILLK